MKPENRKNNIKRLLRAVGAAGTAVCLLLCASACAGADGRELHTMYAGERTETPVVTVYITVPVVVTEAPDGRTSAPVQTSAPETGTVGPEVTKAPETTAAETVEISNFNYDTAQSTVTLASSGSLKSTMILRYPVITGLDNATLQSKVNTLLQQIADVECRAQLDGVDDFLQKGITVTAEITEAKVMYIGPDFLCVRFSGKNTYSDASNDCEFAFSSVINLSTGKSVSEKNIYSDFGKVIELFSAGGFTAQRETAELKANMTAAGLMSSYTEYAKYGTYPDTYLTKDSLCIIIKTDRAWGGWAEYSVPLDKVSAYLKIHPAG